jgi:hypothetical protein
MRWSIVLLLLSSVAHADGDRFSLMGLGTSVVDDTAGWDFRIESGSDALNVDTDTASVIMGAHVGLDVWGANGRWGFSLPIGWYTGAQASSMRSRIGGGIGLITLEGGDGFTGGIAPFASTALEKTMGELIVAVEGRVTRQIISDERDHNVYGVMLMAGRRFRD